MSGEYSGPLRTYRHRAYFSGEKGEPQAWLQIRRRWWQVLFTFRLWDDHSHVENPRRVAEAKVIELAYDLQEALNLVKEVEKTHGQVTARILSNCPRSGKLPNFKDKPAPIEGEVIDRSKEFKDVLKAIDDGSMFTGKATTRRRGPKGNSTIFYPEGTPPPNMHFEGGDADTTHAWKLPKQQQNQGGNKGNKNQQNNRNS